MNNGEQFFNTSAAGGYAIERSLRFNSSDSAYLSRVFPSAGNRRTFTLSFWIKRTILGTGNRRIFGINGSGGTNQFSVMFDSADALYIYGNSTGTTIGLTSAGVFRDVSAWYHIVLAVDTTQAAAANRFKAYVNGSSVAGSYTYPSQNDQLFWNNADTHYIGRYAAGYYTDDYLADVHFIDGQALDPTSFGEFDTNGVWQPIEYAGTYGTNGFHLPFSDNSTAAALGTDTSGAGNNWTVNNISVAAGAGNDSLVDTPTNYGTDTGAGGEVRGNYCTWNAVSLGTDATLSDGNLKIAYGSSGTRFSTVGTFGITSGKWYWETQITASSLTNTSAVIGISSTSSSSSLPNYPGFNALGWGYEGTTGSKYHNLTGASYGDVYGVGDVIGVAFDADNGDLYFYKNGTVQNSGTAAYTGLTSGPYFPAIGDGSATNTFTAVSNFGQRPFTYTAPSGFKALCTTNLPDPVVAKPSEVMDVKLYTGNGSTQTISGLGFSPDLVWVKQRDVTRNHQLVDTVRGATLDLRSNTTGAETTTATGLTSFTSDGFSLGADAGYNSSSGTYVAWTWDAGSSTVTNTQGSITSQVRANASAGFSIVTYTGTGSAATVGHGLGISPSFIIIKNRDSARNWRCYHASLGATYYIDLNSTAAVVGPTSGAIQAVSSTTFTVPGSFDLGTIAKYIAYCFAPVAGYSSFGSYVGNGSADGPFVYTGFRPRWVMVKRTDTGNSNTSWAIYDTARSSNPNKKYLLANASAVEGNYYDVDLLSNGFKFRLAGDTTNQTSGTYIYAAFAESPFQFSRAR